MGHRIYNEPDPYIRIWRELVEDIRGLLIHDGRDFGTIAQEAMLAKTTIMKFASDQTQNPHLYTIVRLSRVLRGGNVAAAAKIREIANLVERGVAPTRPSKTTRLAGFR